MCDVTSRRRGRGRCRSPAEQAAGEGEAFERRGEGSVVKREDQYCRAERMSDGSLRPGMTAAGWFSTPPSPLSVLGLEGPLKGAARHLVRVPR